MKKRLVTCLLITAMAAAVFAGCSKEEKEAADSAATQAVNDLFSEVENEEEEVESDLTANAAEAATDEDFAAAIEAAEAEETEMASAAGTGDASPVEEYQDEEEAPAETAAPAQDSDDLIVEPGTQYEVRFGGNVYATMDQVDSNIIDYVYPGYILNIVERNDDYWYKVSYWINGAERTGYIKIQ